MKPTLRDQVGRILGITISPGEWDSVFAEAQVQGRLDVKATNAILLLILKKLDTYEELE